MIVATIVTTNLIAGTWAFIMKEFVKREKDMPERRPDYFLWVIEDTISMTVILLSIWNFRRATKIDEAKSDDKQNTKILVLLGIFVVIDTLMRVYKVLIISSSELRYDSIFYEVNQLVSILERCLGLCFILYTLERVNENVQAIKEHREISVAEIE